MIPMMRDGWPWLIWLIKISGRTRFFYLTDTGRRWDGASVSVRDKVVSGFSGPEFVFRSTSEIIAAAEQGRLPSRIMINMHPQRWTDSYGPWLKELVWQNMKYVVKGFLVRGWWKLF
jgi:hypothetical protein